VDRINKNLSQSQINNEKDDKIKLIIKVLLNYILFNKKLINDIEKKKNGNKKFIDYNNISQNQKYYLITSKFMDKFRSHYLINEFNSFLSNKYKDNLNNDETSINQILKELNEIQIITKNEEKLTTDIKLEENILNFEYEKIPNLNIDLMHPKNFEIIDINFYNDFIIKKKLDNFNQILESQLIINNGKIIISPIYKSLDDNAIILIGHLKNINNFLDTQFISDIFLYFSDDKIKSPMIAGLKYKDYINAINEEKLTKNVFIYFFDETLKKGNQNNTNNNNVQNNNNIIISNIHNGNLDNNIQNNNQNNIYNAFESGKKIIKLFLTLIMHYEKMNENINF